MANKELHSIIKINNEDYSITANKVANQLTIKNNSTETSFDGSAAVTLDLSDYAKKTDIPEGQDLSAYALKSELFSKNYNDLTNKPTIPTNTNQTIKADGKTFGANDVVELVGGSNVTISGDTSGKKITISATGGGGGDVNLDNYYNKTEVNNLLDSLITHGADDPDTGTLSQYYFKY